MDLVCIDGEYYDPYFILGVTVDDTDEHVAKAYRIKAKKYHPDKASKENQEKYTKRFKIVYDSYEYIRNKRTHVFKKGKHTRSEEKTLKQIQSDTSKRIHNTNDTDDANNTDDTKRLQTVDEYESIKFNIANQFQDKKFSLKKFNQIFDYVKSQSEDALNVNTALIHKSTDGFFGFPTADLTIYSSVSTYNGLLVSKDEFDGTGVGYWGENFSDYKKTFDVPKNPTGVVKVPSAFNKSLQTSKTKHIQPNEAEPIPPPKTSFTTQQKELFDKVKSNLIEKEKEDKKIVLKHATQQYPQDTLRAAMSGQLEASPTLLLTLHQHYNMKQLEN